jgi:hypothetical protein
MEGFIEFILQFGNLNKQQINLITKKATETELRKESIFLKREKFHDRLVSFWKESFAFAITTTKAKKLRTI